MSTNQNIPQLTSKFVFFLIAAIFLGFQFRYAINAPYAQDDARFFVFHFINRYVEGDSFIDKIKYHFSVTNYPHSKLSGRFFSTLYYELTGSVSFKFLIILGSAILVFFVFLVRKILDLNYIVLLPLTLLLFTPDLVSQWVGPISGYPFLLIYALIIFHLLSKGKFVLPVIIAFICSFTHSPGLGVFLAAFPLFLISPNNAWIKRISWLAMFIFTAFVYWATIISKNSLVRSEDSREIADIVSCLPSMIAYEGQFLALPFLENRTLSKTLQSVPILAVGLAFIVLTACLAIIWVRRKSFDPKFASLLAFLIFCMLPGPISAFVSDNCTSFNDIVAPRYMMYSMMAWTGLYIFFTNVLKPRQQIIAAVLFSALFLPRFVQVYQDAPGRSNALSYKWLKRGTFNQISETGKPENFSKLIKAKETGVFSAQLPEYSIGLGDVKNVEENWNDFWYRLNINDYYCRLEVLTHNAEEVLVEVWATDIDALSTTQRYVLETIPPKRTRNTWLKTKANTPRDLRKSSIRAYFYVTENEGQCDTNLRFRQGNKLSSPLEKSNG